MTDNLSFSDLLSSTWGIILIIIFFGGSIFVHELGHFLAARRRGLKIERFSIGFGPRLFGWTGKDGVDYRISIIPLGGYVALPQLAEMEGIEGESSADAESLPKISYADKMIVSVMGAVFNVIFAVVLACILWATGMPVPEGSSSTVIGYVQEQIVASSGHLDELGLGNTIPGPAYEAGLRSGDRILTIDDSEVTSFNQISEAILLGNRRDARGNPTATFLVERDGKKLELTVHPALIQTNSRSNDRIREVGIKPRSSVIIAEIAPNSPAEKAGLKSGDRVVSIDGHPLNNSIEFRELLRKGMDTPRTLIVERKGEPNTSIVVTPQVVTTVHPVGIVAYGEEGKKHSLIVVPVTHDLLDKDPSAPRDQLMLLGISPEDPQLEEVLRIGTIIDKVDAQTQIISTRSLSSFSDAIGTTPRDLTLYWKRNNGESGNITLREANTVSKQPILHAQIGTSFVTQTTIAHINPWEICTGIIQSTITTLGRLFDRGSDIQVNQLASVISIAKVYYNLSEDIRRVLWFTILINLNLAVLNLLPIPVLDGGHMLIATIQNFAKGFLSNKAVIILQYTFLGLLLLLMSYIIYHDVRRCSGDTERQLKQQILERHVFKPQDFKAVK